MKTNVLEVNQQTIDDWRAAVLRGEPLTEEQLAAAVEAYRKSRTAAEPRGKAKPKAEKVPLDSSIFD